MLVVRRTSTVVPRLRRAILEGASSFLLPWCRPSLLSSALMHRALVARLGVATHAAALLVSGSRGRLGNRAASYTPLGEPRTAAHAAATTGRRPSRGLNRPAWEEPCLRRGAIGGLGRGGGAPSAPPPGGPAPIPPIPAPGGPPGGLPAIGVLGIGGFAPPPPIFFEPAPIIALLRANVFLLTLPPRMPTFRTGLHWIGPP